jgi:MFS family permease
LLASSWVTNLGDGIAIAAGPLLVASRTDQPALIALAATVQWLPPLLFGLGAGVVSDRLDRRLVTVNAVRVGVVAALAGTVLTGRASITWYWSRCSCSAPPRSSSTTPPTRWSRCWCTARTCRWPTADCRRA